LVARLATDIELSDGWVHRAIFLGT
ncbi:MAG: hypothetical protein JWN15_4059, partial [Firmicutes bacterium]|nr:hypothetical protein [Bacillota bacterium]